VPKSNPRLSFGSELGFRFYSTSVRVIFPASSLNDGGSQSYSFQPTYIRLGPSVRYSFSRNKSKIRPFINVGGSFSYAVSLQSTYEMVQKFGSTQQVLNSGGLADNESAKFETGLFVGGGLKIYRLMFEIRGETGSSLFGNFVNYSSSTKSCSLYVGYVFSKRR